MNVLVAGGTGFVGRRLIQELSDRGDRVTVLTRDIARARGMLPPSVTCVAWETVGSADGLGEVDRADAVVNLAGEPVAQRWTSAVKRRIEASRIESTRKLVDAMARVPRRRRVFVCASATGYYGPRPPGDQLDEGAAPGTGFLADVVLHWEQAAQAAEAHGARSAQLRIGVVLGEGGGALEKMVLPFRLFAGGPIGVGTQVVSWIHRDDVVALVRLAIDDERATGPINAVAPNAVTAAELAHVLGDILNRPSYLRIPSVVVKLAMGEASEILTQGQRVVPTRALELGHTFRYPEIVGALASILGGRR
jgi:uncharacterized protein (TIGR01777 family)